MAHRFCTGETELWGGSLVLGPLGSPWAVKRCLKSQNRFNPWMNWSEWTTMLDRFERMFVLACTWSFRLLVMLARFCSVRFSVSRFVSRLVNIPLAVCTVVSSFALRLVGMTHWPSEPFPLVRFAVMSLRLSVMTCRFVTAGRALAATALRLAVNCVLLDRTAPIWLVRFKKLGSAALTCATIADNWSFNAGSS